MVALLHIHNTIYIVRGVTKIPPVRIPYKYFPLFLHSDFDLVFIKYVPKIDNINPSMVPVHKFVSNNLKTCKDVYILNTLTTLQ